MAQIDLNKASADELQRVPGLGRQAAEDLVRYRDQRGSFHSWEDLREIPGVSDSTIERMRGSGVMIGEERGSETMGSSGQEDQGETETPGEGKGWEDMEEDEEM